MKNLTRNLKLILLSVLALILAIAGVLAVTLGSSKEQTADAQPEKPIFWDWPDGVDQNSVIIKDTDDAFAYLQQYWSVSLDSGNSDQLLYMNTATKNFRYCFNGLLYDTVINDGLLMSVPYLLNKSNNNKFVVVTYGIDRSSPFSILKNNGGFVSDTTAISSGYINFNAPSSIFFINPSFYLDSEGNYFFVVLSADSEKIVGVGGSFRKIYAVGVVYLGEKGLYESKQKCTDAGDKLLQYATDEKIPVPEPAELTYSGTTQYAFDRYSEQYTVTGDGQRNAGTYEAEITPKKGYCWEDGTTDTKKVPFTIARKPTDPPKSKTYTYNSISKNAYYDTSTYTVEGGTATATDAGTYKVKVKPTENYCWNDLEGEAAESEREIEWTIQKGTLPTLQGNTANITLKKGSSGTYKLDITFSGYAQNYTGHLELKLQNPDDAQYCKLYVPDPDAEEQNHANCHKFTLYNKTNKDVVSIKLLCEFPEDDNFEEVRGDKAAVWTINIKQAGGFYLGDKDATIDGLETEIYYDLAEAVKAYNNLENKDNMYIHVSDQAAIDKPVTIDSSVKIIGDDGSTLSLTGAGSDQSMLTVKQGGKLEFDNVKFTDERTHNPTGSAVKIAGGNVEIKNSSFSNCKATNGGAIYVDGGTLTVSDSSFTGNSATESGGAIYVADGEVKIGTGVKIENNSADFGSGIVVADGKKVTVASDAFGGLSDGIGLRGQSQIVVSGTVSGDDKLVVEFEKPNEQLSASHNGYQYVTGDSGTDLKRNLRVKNAGYTFNPGDTSLTLVSSTDIVAMVVQADGTAKDYYSLQEAVNAAENDGTVYLVQAYNKENNVKPEPIVLDKTLTIPEGKTLTFDSAVRLANGSEYTYYYNGNSVGNTFEKLKSELPDVFGAEGSTTTTVKRGDSLTDEMIKVESGATLNLGNVILDGGANWDKGMPAPDGKTWTSWDSDTPIKITDKDGEAGTVVNNNTGVKAHAPVIVNNGTLNLNDGSTIQNNDNNWATPGDGFGSQNYGGGVRNQGSGTLTMKEGATIKDCYSREGGAIMNVNKPNTPAYDENGNPTVTIEGGNITGNVSQTKGAAIQNVYGGANTEVKGGTIEKNHSLNDVGVLTVEEGAKLTVSGGTITAGTDKNALYLYNQYGKEAVEGAQEDARPYIENKKAGELIITGGTEGTPNINGKVHLDNPCTADADNGKTYDPYVDVKGYSGDLTLDVNENRPSGKIAVGSKEELGKLKTEIDKQLKVDSTEHKGGYTVLVKCAGEGEDYELRSASYNPTVTQTESGKLEFTGFDPNVTSVSVTIDGTQHTLKEKEGEKGVYVLDYTGGTSVEITEFTFGYGEGDEKVTVDVTDSLTCGVVQFNSETLKLELPKDATYLATDNTYHTFESGLLPNDIKIENGDITVKIGGEERTIHIGDRAEAPTEKSEELPLIDATKNADGKYDLTIEGADELEYNLTYVENGETKFVYNSFGEWMQVGEDGYVTFKGLDKDTKYTVVARRKSIQKDEGRLLASAYTTQGALELTDDEATKLDAYNTAYENVEGGLWNGENVTASVENLEAVIKAYGDLPEKLQGLKSVTEGYPQVLESYPYALAKEWKEKNKEILGKVTPHTLSTDDKAALVNAITSYNDLGKTEAGESAQGLVQEDYNKLLEAYKEAIRNAIEKEIDQWFTKNTGEKREDYKDITSFFISQVEGYDLNPLGDNVENAVTGLNLLIDRTSAALDIQQAYNEAAKDAPKMSEARQNQLYAANITAITEVQQNTDSSFNAATAVNKAKAEFEEIKNKGIAEKLYLDAYLAIKGKEATWLIILLSVLIGLELIGIVLVMSLYKKGEKGSAQKMAAIAPVPALAAVITIPANAFAICLGLGITAAVLAVALVAVFLLKKFSRKPAVGKNSPEEAAAENKAEAATESNEPEEK